VAFAVLRSLTAPGIALVARGLINAAVQVTRQDSHGLSSFAPWLVAALGLAMLEALVPVADRFFRDRLADDLGFAITSRVLGHAAMLDSAVLENPEHRETIDRVQHDAVATLPRYISELELGVTSASQTVLLGAVLTYVEPLVLPVLVPLAVPYVLTECRRTNARRARTSAHNTTRRWSRYFGSALLGDRTAAPRSAYSGSRRSSSIGPARSWRSSGTRTGRSCAIRS